MKQAHIQLLTTYSVTKFTRFSRPLSTHSATAGSLRSPRLKKPWLQGDSNSSKNVCNRGELILKIKMIDFSNQDPRIFVFQTFVDRFNYNYIAFQLHISLKDDNFDRFYDIAGKSIQVSWITIDFIL